MTDKAREAAVLQTHGAAFEAQTAPSLLLARACGNSYCASVWGGLASLIEARGPQLALGAETVLLFSYGSGCASTAMLLQARPCQGAFTLDRACQQARGAAVPGKLPGTGPQG